MKMTYDKVADAAYIYLDCGTENKKVSKTVEVARNLIVDFGSKGEIIGLEILDAALSIDQHDLMRGKKEPVDIPVISIA